MNEDLSTPLRSSFDGNSDANTISQSGSPQKTGGKLGTVLGLFYFQILNFFSTSSATSYSYFNFNNPFRCICPMYIIHFWGYFVSKVAMGDRLVDFILHEHFSEFVTL